MTAFAAVRTLEAAIESRDDLARMSDRLSASTGRSTAVWQTDGCALLMAPLHSWDATAPVRSTDRAIVAVGQVMCEDGRALATEVGAPAAAFDLEVVASALSPRAGLPLSRLRGEYAFAGWNTITAELICARDPLGVRMLYVGEGAGVVIVSNCLEAVVAHSHMPTTLDDVALVRFLATGAITTTGATHYRRVRMLPAGHALRIERSGRIRLERHFRPRPVTPLRLSAAELTAGYRSALRASIRDRAGDRRATIFLSGGLDSTTIAVEAKACRTDLHAITLRYQLPSVSREVPLALSVAERLGIRASVVDADRYVALDAERRGRPPAQPQDEPTLSDWREALDAAARHSTLAIYGEDGDTLFSPPGGADLFAVQSIASTLWRSLPCLAQDRRLPYFGVRLRERLRRWHGGPPAVRLPAWLTSAARQMLDGPESDRLLGAQPEPLVSPSPVWTRLLVNVPFDFSAALSPDSAGPRVSLTLPPMDSRLIEFVTGVPPIPWRQQKRLVRVAYADDLPKEVLSRQKTPVSGSYEALIDRWRAEQNGRLPSITLDIGGAGWVDVDMWRQTLLHGPVLEAVAALRVLMLEAWLAKGTGSHVLTH